MPQASDELRQKMKDRFGDDWLEEGPVFFLRAAGYTLTKDWCWKKEGVGSVEDMTDFEYDCLAFMADEWDYGGLAVDFPVST